MFVWDDAESDDDKAIGGMDSDQEGLSPPESDCKAGVAQSGSSLDA